MNLLKIKYSIALFYWYVILMKLWSNTILTSKLVGEVEFIY